MSRKLKSKKFENDYVWLEQRREKRWEVFMRFIFPIILPFIVEGIGYAMVSNRLWIVNAVKLAVITCGGLFIGFYEMRFARKQKKLQDEKQVSDAARLAYSNAFDLMMTKRDSAIKRARKSDYVILPEHTTYDVKNYIVAICNQIRNTIADITGIRKEHMSVSFIYQYDFEGASEKDRTWKWITGKEPDASFELIDYVKKEGTLFHYMVHGFPHNSAIKSRSLVYDNDKQRMERNSIYHMSARDRRHNMIGSVVCARVDFCSHAEKLVRGILTVSSYGHQFVESVSEEDDERMKHIITNEILPYYQQLLEYELGVLYFQHKGKQRRK